MASPPPPEDALSDDGLERLFASLSQASGIVAAVSGGPDSTVLMHLLARWAASGSALIVAESARVTSCTRRWTASPSSVRRIRAKSCSTYVVS